MFAYKRNTHCENLLKLLAVQEANRLEKTCESLDAHRSDDTRSIDIDENGDHEMQEPAHNLGLRAKEIRTVQGRRLFLELRQGIFGLLH